MQNLELSMEAQSTFIETLKLMTPPHLSLADQISELLSISKDSAYRRLRNETPFTLDETVSICRALKIDATALIQGEPSRILFTYNHLYGETKGFIEYLNNNTGMIKQVTAAGGKIIYAAEDIPMFLHFAYPTLAGFKLFYWSKAVLNDETYVDRKFARNLLHPDLIEAADRVLKAYNNCPSIEIWTTESIHSTLRQIIYYAESFQFNSKEDAIQVIHELRSMINDLEIKCKNSSKLLDNPEVKNFEMYNSEVLIGNNTVILEGIPKPVVFISHNTFNTIRTTSDFFYDETKLWINNLIQKSTHISGVSEKYRIKFFKEVNDAIDSTEESLNKFDF